MPTLQLAHSRYSVTGRLDRYGEPVDETAADEHDGECHGGFLGSEDTPRPCPRCRPWLVRRAGRWTVDRNAVESARRAS
jgi:hypothetical protein